jgi:hypothetical protein
MIRALLIFILGSRFWLVPNQNDSKEQVRLFGVLPVIPPRYYLVKHLSCVILLCRPKTWAARTPLFSFMYKWSHTYFSRLERPFLRLTDS